MNARIIFSGALLTTMACTPVPPESHAGDEPVPVRHGTGRRCNADPAQSLIGRDGTAESGAEALRLTGAGVIRWIRPGAMVTMDYRQDRVNVHLDAANKITQIRCG